MYGQQSNWTLDYNGRMMSTQDPAVLVFVFDLFFVSRIESVAGKIGARSDFWEKNEAPPPKMQLMEELVRLYAGRDPSIPDLILLDLSTPGFPWESWVKSLRSLDDLAETPLVAFGSHVQVDILALARSAGATAALAKSRFTAQMPQIIGKYLT